MKEKKERYEERDLYLIILLPHPHSRSDADATVGRLNG
jgi:hypothetical protein